jgi:outer membrane protein OmpA-like peptidoglycan-associated protein
MVRTSLASRSSLHASSLPSCRTSAGTFGQKRNTGALMLLGFMTLLAGCESKKAEAGTGLLPQGHETAVSSAKALESSVQNATDAYRKQVASFKADVKAVAGRSKESPEAELLWNRADAKCKAHDPNVKQLEETLAKHQKALAEAQESHDSSRIIMAVNAATRELTPLRASVTKWQEELSASTHDLVFFRQATAETSQQIGELNFSDIDFAPGSAEVDTKSKSSAAGVARLVAFTKTCKELRYVIHGHTSREGSAEKNEQLSLERAKAIEQLLIDKGINKEQVLSRIGHGSAIPMIAEPAPGSAEEKAMPKDELERIRIINRRIAIEVKVPCPHP